MSQSNETTPQQPKKSNSIIYWVFILILLAGCVYLFMSKNKMAEDNDLILKQKQQQIDSVKTDRASLQSDFDAASAKIDQLTTQNAKMDSALQGDKEAMAKLRNQISAVLHNEKATKEELKQAREMINSLNDKTKQYEARIAELEKENTVLTGQNKTLAKERDSTATQNAVIKKIGSVLTCSNIRMEPIHLKKNGKEKETTKAKKVDVLRIMFDIDENRIAESGTKQIYLRILSSDGNAMTSAANGSGMLNTIKGDQMSFSLVKSVPLTQGQPLKNVMADWKQEGDYAKGAYTIEIYSEGYKVGSGSVTLK
jgi:cell division protein FtsB